MSDDLVCEKHNLELKCIAGCSAHIDNWYCPECGKEDDEGKDND